MSDIRFNNWYHQSGTGGVTQTGNGSVGIGSTIPTTELDVAGEGNFSSSTSATPTLTLTNSGGAGSGTGTGAIITKFVGDSDSIVIRNINAGHYGIYNDQQNNGIEFYDGTSGVIITYNGAARLTANNAGVNIDGVLSGDGSGLTNLTSVSSVLSSSQSASGSDTVTFTDVPAGVNRITVMFRDLSLSGGNNISIQLGTSSAWINSGYSSLSSGESGSTDSSSTTSFIIRSGDASNNAFGQMIISRFGSGSWVQTGQFKMTNSTSSQCYGDLGGYGGGTITRLRIQTSGANTFDGGDINVLYG